MVTIETVFEIGKIVKNDATCPIIHSCGKYTKNMSITLSFVLKQKTRTTIGDRVVPDVYPNEQFLQMSPAITWVPQNGLCQADMRNKLYDLGVTSDEIQSTAMTIAENYVDELVERHLFNSGQPGWSIEGLKVNLFFTIYRVTVHQYAELIRINPIETEEGVDHQATIKAADKSIVRKLKRKRVDETMVGEDEKCSVCLEMLVEKEELIVLPCEHLFHEGCVSKWFNKSRFCPLCRFELRPVAQKPKTSAVDWM